MTTVLGGNCGFSLAPMAPEHVDYISRMMARVEGMPLAALRAGVPWDWGSFGDWLGRLDGRIAVNAGFLVGHSTLRRLVMGERAVGGAATAQDIDAMEAALHAALAEGALGFSTSQVHTHNDGDGQPVPSRRRPARRWSAWPPRCASTRAPRSSSSSPAASTGSARRTSTSWPPCRCWRIDRSTGTSWASRP